MDDKVSIKLVTDSEKLNDMINVLSQSKMIAIDTEFKNKTLSLIQISNRDVVYLIDCIEFKMSKEEAKTFSCKIFNNPNIVILGFSIWNDFKIIEDQVDGINKNLNTRNSVDLQVEWDNIPEIVFPFQELALTQNKCLANLVLLCSGKKLDKSNQLSNWLNRPLREDQKKYAATDAYCLFMINDVFREAKIKSDLHQELIKKKKKSNRN